MKRIKKLNKVYIQESSSFSFFEDIVGSFLLEINFNISGGEFLVSSFDGGNSFFEEMLISLVEGNFGDL